MKNVDGTSCAGSMNSASTQHAFLPRDAADQAGSFHMSSDHERYAEYKDSGVEWIGKISDDWRVKRLRYLGSCQNGLSKGAEFFGSGFPFVAYGNVYRNELNPCQITGKVESTKNERDLYSVCRGGALFTRTSETVDEVGFAATALEDIPDACFAGFLIRARPTSDELLPEYVAYYYRSDFHRALC